MTKANQATGPFFITPEIAVEMTADGYEFEPPLTPCTSRLRDVLGRMSDAELALQSDEIASPERDRRLRMSKSTS